jgi:hypothetical protein
MILGIRRAYERRTWCEERSRLKLAWAICNARGE